MRLPKLSNPYCAMPVREMPAAIPYSRGQSNSSPRSKRKSVNAAVPRILNSSRKNIPLLCGISSMPSSASTPSIHAVSWRSPSRSPVLGRASHGDTKTQRKVPAHRAAVVILAAFSAFRFQHFSIFLRASCMPDSNASLRSRTQAWI